MVKFGPAADRSAKPATVFFTFWSIWSQFAKKKFWENYCKSTPNGPKREKTVANFANRSAAGPSGGPNLTIFAGRQYQIKVPYRVSLNSIQKYGLGPQRRICCNLFITHTGTTNMVFCGGGGG